MNEFTILTAIMALMFGLIFGHIWPRVKGEPTISLVIALWVLAFVMMIIRFFI